VLASFLCARFLAHAQPSSAFSSGPPNLGTGPRTAVKNRFVYQLDFFMPGISPLWASERRHKRQHLNLRRYARDRPHNSQRLYARVLNFGVFLTLAFQRILAIPFSPCPVVTRAIGGALS
jgi:hypothetical protein